MTTRALPQHGTHQREECVGLKLLLMDDRFTFRRHPGTIRVIHADSGMVESPHAQNSHKIAARGWKDGQGAEVCEVSVAAKERIYL